MHIVHLGKYYDPVVGGMESLVQSQANAEAAAGHQVDVVVMQHRWTHGRGLWQSIRGKSQSRAESRPNVTIHRVPRIASVAKYDVPVGLARTLTALAKTQPTVWHLHTPNPTMLVAVQRILNRCQPLVVTHHSDIINQTILKPAYEWLERSVYRHAKRLISDSAPYIEGSSQLVPFRDKVDSIPLGIVTSDFTHASPEVVSHEKTLRQKYGVPLWLCVGRLANYKGFDVAIRALPKVSGTLAIIGAGPAESELKKLVAQLGLEQRVVWLGKCGFDQLRAAYRAATALWFPSNARNEGFGLVQVEAMASGCPVINTEIPHSGASTVSLHDVTGFTVPMNAPDALADAAQRLLDQPALRTRFAAAAVRRAVEQFDISVVTKQRLALYQAVAT
jgi:glycosyltransferase involved in cell wall biosynthesis